MLEFVLRKLVHIGSGFIYVAIPYPYPPITPYWTIPVAIAVILGGFLLNDNRPDTGITAFGVVGSVVVLGNLPMRWILPVLFCDPVAALVGRSTQIIFGLPQGKSAVGTIAFTLTSSVLLEKYWALQPSLRTGKKERVQWSQRTRLFMAVSISSGLALVEFLSGRYDNWALGLSSLICGCLYDNEPLFTEPSIGTTNERRMQLRQSVGHKKPTEHTEAAPLLK